MTSVEQENMIRIEDDRITIEKFQTRDREIISYFENLGESDDLGQKLESALKMGVVATKSIDIAGNVNYVEKAFENLDEKMRQELESAFGQDGKFSGILQDHFGDDGRIIKELFDPHREGSPLFSLRTEFERYFRDLREQLALAEAEDELVEISPQKGFEFEDVCEAKLEWIARIHSDKLERTGTSTGRISRSKKGDFVLTLGDVGKKMVFEMKDRRTISLPEVQKELKEAMENREADYGIYVVKNKRALPDHVGWFNEYDGNQLVCALENDEGDSLIDGEIIHIAYKWARARLRTESSKEKRLDPAFIMEKAGTIQKKVGEMRKIRTQCKNIENSTDAIKTTARETERAIKDDLEEIIESLDFEE